MKRILSISGVLSIGIAVCLGVVYLINHHKGNEYQERLNEDIAHIAKTDSLIASAGHYLVKYDMQGNLVNLIDEIDETDIDKINDLKNQVRNITAQLESVRKSSLKRETENSQSEYVQTYDVDSLNFQLNTYESEINSYMSELKSLKAITADSIKRMKSNIDMLRQEIEYLSRPEIVKDTLYETVIIVDSLHITDKQIVKRIKKKYLN